MEWCDLCWAREVAPGSDWCPRCLNAYLDGRLDDRLKKKADRITGDQDRFSMNVKVAVKISEAYNYDEQNESFWKRQHPGVVSLVIKVALQKAKTKSHDKFIEDIKKTIRDEEIKSGRRIAFRPSWMLTEEQYAEIRAKHKK